MKLTKPRVIIAPSILTLKWSQVHQQLRKLNHPLAKWIHFDVMDGCFVPNTTYTPNQAQEIINQHNFYLDVHLMVSNPLVEASKYAKVGANSITFHYEASHQPHKVINHIKSLGCKVGLAIKPHTQVEQIYDLLDKIDLVLVMSVEPGKGRQSFIHSSISKIKQLASWQAKFKYLIQVDGGIKDFNAQQVIDAGANVLVCGSYIFDSQDYNQQVSKIVSFMD